MKKHFLRFSIAIFTFVLLSVSIYAQQVGSYAITNADVVLVSGPTITDATIVIRDGLIESVGKNISIPADAKVFDGRGLTVYPGFFDTNTDLGIQKAPPTRGGQNAQSNQPQSNSNYPESLRPEQTAAEKLKAGEAQFAAQRNNGFTTVLTVEDSGIFEGQSAVINLAGDSVSSMIIRSPFAQHVAFRTERGGQFPSSLMGTFAALRQMFLDAKRLNEIQKMYDKNSRGMKRPEKDTALEALMPIINGQMPIVFNANTEREIIRVVDLAKEFNLRAIISGGSEAGRVADRLKAQNIPVLLSLNFPKRTLTENKEADPESLETLRLRAEVPKTAAKLKQAGVKFAFQSGELKNIGDFWGNAEETTKNGLAKSDAIRAMTLDAAEILGVKNQLGSIETGKIANLVVMKGDIFADDKTITHVFIDGKVFEMPKKPEKKPGDDTTGETGKIVQVGGTWTLTIAAPGQSIDAQLVLDQQGNVLTGTMNSTFFGSATIKNGTATANGFSFDATISIGGQEINTSFNGTVSDNKMEGTVSLQEDAATFTGTKNP
ncbi:MAG: amidohydrolase family protein [Acidobacteriota bacterium]|nr:amidohydrolase family protein [Acidobacteriota bacterium]